jgi:hypothetical protein
VKILINKEVLTELSEKAKIFNLDSQDIENWIESLAMEDKKQIFKNDVKQFFSKMEKDVKKSANSKTPN